DAAGDPMPTGSARFGIFLASNARKAFTTTLALAVAALPLADASHARADATTLCGIHWWGYTPNLTIDNAPATMMNCPTFSAWDVETALTNSETWWAPDYFVPLYQDLVNNKNISVITR